MARTPAVLISIALMVAAGVLASWVRRDVKRGAAKGWIQWVPSGTCYREEDPIGFKSTIIGNLMTVISVATLAIVLLLNALIVWK